MLLIAAILFMIPSRGLQAAAGELDPTFGKGGQVTADFFGNGAVTYLVSPDMTGSPRKGLITIGGKSFSVKQNG